jgi:hypothetical protein
MRAEPLIVSMMPAPGWFAAMAPEEEHPVEFWRLVGWALVERNYGDDEPNIERRVEGLIATGDGVELCEDRQTLESSTTYLFLGYEDRDSPNPADWEDEARRTRKNAKGRERRSTVPIKE